MLLRDGQTLPRATVHVAMSSRKPSPSFPGAPTATGFVPSVGYSTTMHEGVQDMHTQNEQEGKEGRK